MYLCHICLLYTNCINNHVSDNRKLNPQNKFMLQRKREIETKSNLHSLKVFIVLFRYSGFDPCFVYHCYRFKMGRRLFSIACDILCVC